MTGCKIGKIRMKNGGAEIRVIPTATNSTLIVPFAWGEVVFRLFNGEEIQPRDALYLLRSAEDLILYGKIDDD